MEAFAVNAVKDELLPFDIDGFPLSGDEVRDLLENLPVVTMIPGYAPENPHLPFDDNTGDFDWSPYELWQINSAHARSFILRGGNINKPWTDEYGNGYSAATLKGNNFSNPSLTEHPAASEGYIAWGLQESAVIERIIRASRYMRERNISTEHILGLAEPKQYPWPIVDQLTNAHTMLSLQEYKRRIVSQHWEELPEDERTPEFLTELYQKFENMTFYVSLRAMDSPYRVKDLADGGIQREVYDYINEHMLPEGVKPFDPRGFGESRRYHHEFLMPRVAVNLARLHHAGLVHKFLHNGNITVLGGLVDLDSIYGEPLGLGDDIITHDQMASDLQSVITGVLSDRDFLWFNRGDKISIPQPLNTLLMKYADEIIRLSDDIEEARNLIGYNLVALNRRDSVYRAEYRHIYSMMKVGLSKSYCEQFLGIDMEPILLQLKEVLDEGISHEISPELYAEMKQAVVKDIEYYARKIASDFTEDVDEAYEHGDIIDLYDILMDDPDSAAIDGMAIEIGRPYVIERLSGIRDYLYESYADFLKDHHRDNLDIAVIDIYFDTLVNQICGAYVEAMCTLVKEKLLEDIEPELRKALDYRVPDNIMGTQEGTVVAGFEFHDKTFWLKTEGVDLEYILLNAGQFDVEVDTLDDKIYLHREKCESLIFSNREGFYPTQIVTDVPIINSREVADHKVAIEFGTTRKPSYLMVVLENDEGERVTELYLYSKVVESLTTVMNEPEMHRRLFSNDEPDTLF